MESCWFSLLALLLQLDFHSSNFLNHDFQGGTSKKLSFRLMLISNLKTRVNPLVFFPTFHFHVFFGGRRRRQQKHTPCFFPRNTSDDLGPGDSASTRRSSLPTTSKVLPMHCWLPVNGQKPTQRQNWPWKPCKSFGSTWG